MAAVSDPLAEYLSTTYRPDREYIDGELRERHVGKVAGTPLFVDLNPLFDQIGERR